MMKAERPNVVLIVSDDHGLDTGCYGNPLNATPNIDALAADGVRFTQAFCTTASCAASRSVMLTGLYNHANGTYGHTHGAHHFSCFDDVVSLPTLLKESGYHTARIGKFHHAPEKAFPFDTVLPAAGRDDKAMAESCRDVVSGDSPFFLYWCSFNPHRGGGKLTSHPEQPDRFGNPEHSFPGDQEQLFNEDEVVVPAYLNDTPAVRAELAQYYQSTARLDRGIGRLIDILKESGQYDNTLVIYLSDNGPAFPSAKTTLYEPGMRLPCIVRSPRHKKRGTTCSGLISWADLTPTILDFTGTEHDPEAFHGKSFRPILDQESPSNWREEIYAAHTFHEITNYYPMRVVRTHKYKFIWNIAHKLDYSSAADLFASATWQDALHSSAESLGMRTLDAYIHRPRFELYDLETDPDELCNLAESRPELVDEFCAKIKAFQARTNDPWIHKWEYE